MPTTISTGSLRQHLSDTLTRAQREHDRIVVERNGQPVAAIVSVEDLEALEALEDADDLRAADEARREGGAWPLADVVRELEEADDIRAAEEARRESGDRPMEDVFRNLDTRRNG